MNMLPLLPNGLIAHGNKADIFLGVPNKFPGYFFAANHTRLSQNIFGRQNIVQPENVTINILWAFC